MDVFDRVKTPEPAGVLRAHRNCALDSSEPVSESQIPCWQAKYREFPELCSRRTYHSELGGSRSLSFFAVIGGEGRSLLPFVTNRSDVAEADAQ
jgi:hypothetical protein